MKLRRRQLLRLAVGAAALPALPRIASAQAFPTRPVTLVVPFGAGGPTDTIARILAQGMQELLGQPVVVENVSGASGTIAVGRVARAAADGYTFVLGGWATHVLNGSMFDLPYDLVKDFEPISLVCYDSELIVARQSMPATNLKEFIAWLKANPDKATQGTSGAGAFSSVVGQFFQRETGTHVQLVPYRGGLGPAMLDLVAGRIDFMIDLPGDCLSQLHAGTIKAYAVMSKTRLKIAPDIPTVDEAGLPGLYANAWQAAFLPRGVSKDIVAKLNTAVVAALADPAVRRRLAEIGEEVFPREEQTPEAARALQKAEIAKWWPIVKAAGIKIE